MSKEIKTAILVIAALLLVIFGYNYLKGNNLLDKSKILYAKYDNVEGLAPSSQVTINGLPVGRVMSIDFADSSGKLVVKFVVEKDFEFSNNSLARVYGGGLIGGKSLAIIPSYEKGRNAKTGDTLPGEMGEGIMELVNERLTPLQNQVEKVIGDTDSLLVNVNSVLDRDTRANLRDAIANFTDASREMKGISKSVNGLLASNQDKLDRTITNLDKMSGNFATLSDSLSKIQMGQMVADLEKTIADFQELSNKLNSPEGTVGKLLNDDQLYLNLDRTANQMGDLLQDMKLNPKRYVHFSLFGKKPGEYTPPKDSLQ
ncbi:phospholipid/cholesterol/gamma-HCH transport system substrate-binding protein [Dokdonia sp. Hel_I_63]|jgi:phospholipid/cholesterol/gamma-HCH transport system substrate-binding protein|uniref:MlaD family protein n=1 Tax=unclassified Dokdonia TaxID=2615033 RepID=UPI00020A70E6|nr:MULTISPECIES: MlaD family protein [unclassified Dokdonia]AEE18068.1 Mammalian cell entry related domain protein [Dokdonia sp. 4H-3-7-5]TVZ22706.1 phospholipid/cholesterol/gamma-HCH transport system substrate-binding protein [Dokdonia sp. Hel_I_63]